MPANTPHIDRALSEISFRYRNSMEIAEFIFPPKYVRRESDKFHKQDMSGFRVENSGPRAYFEPATRASHTYEEDGFQVDVHSLYDQVPDRQEMDADEPISIVSDATLNLIDKLILRREVDAAAKAFTASSFDASHTSTPGTKWDASGGNPVKDINDAAEVIRQDTGQMPNALVVGGKAWASMQNNSGIVDRFKHTREGTVTERQVSLYWDWLPPDNFRVGRMVQNTAKEGAAKSMADVWGKSALLFYRDEAQANNPRMRARTISFGRNFRPRRDRLVVSSRAWNPPGVNIFAQEAHGLHILEKDCGYLLTSVIA